MITVNQKKRSSEGQDIWVSPALTKLNKFDESLLEDINKCKEKKRLDFEKRCDKFRLPLQVPTTDAMDRILSYFYSAIAHDPEREFVFLQNDTKEGGLYFIDQDEMDFDMDWLSSSREWFDNHLLMDATNAETDEGREFAQEYRKQQLFAYFQSIADAWNAKYTVIQLVPKLSEWGCRFETIQKE